MRRVKTSFNLGGGATRRNFLRGAGVCLALPWLEALVPRAVRGQMSGAPTRFVPIFFPNGASQDHWTPKGQGSGDNWQLSPILQPFADLKSRMITFSNLENYSAMADFKNAPEPPKVDPSHSRCSAAFLTCTDGDALRKVLDVDTANGISVDQLLAQKLAPPTIYKSLQFGLGTTIESGLDGRHESYSRSISWKGETEPLYKEVNPQVVFDRLVSSLGVDQTDTAAVAAEAKRKALKTSVLDSVIANAEHVQARLGAEDRARLDQFLTSVRELEQQVNGVGSSFVANCVEFAKPGSPARYGLANGVDGYDRIAHSSAMNDLIVMALSCDSTRIISYMLDDARSEFLYDHLTVREFTADGSDAGINQGQVGNFHGLQHAGDSNPAFATINWWLSDRVADLCNRLDAVDEGEGSLFDHSVVLYGSGMHGGDHKSNQLPIVLLGGGSGRLKTDQHIVFSPTPDDRPLRDLYYTLLNEVYQVETASFGESKLGASNRTITEMLKTV